MKKTIYSLILSLITVSFYCQQSGSVGINTATPTAILDVNGNLKIRDTPVATVLPDYQIMTINKENYQVEKINSQTLINSTNINSSIYAAKKTTGISLFSIGIFPSGFRAVNFLKSERTTGNAALFSDTDYTYTIPSTGVYAIGFSFRYGSGLQGSILPSSPGVGIVRTRAGVSTIIDSSVFSGLSLLLVSLTISEGHLNSLYALQAGDKISFGLTGSSVLDVGLLNSSRGSFYIYKVSN